MGCVYFISNASILKLQYPPSILEDLLRNVERSTVLRHRRRIGLNQYEKCEGEPPHFDQKRDVSRLGEKIFNAIPHEEVSSALKA